MHTRITRLVAPYVIDVLVCALVLGGLVEDLVAKTVTLDGVEYDLAPEWLVVVVAFAVPTIVALRRRLGIVSPLSALALLGLLSIPAPAWVPGSGFMFVLVLLLCAMTGYMVTRRVEYASLAVVLVVATFAVLRQPDRSWATWAFVAIFCSLAWLLGVIMRRPVAKAQAAEERALRLEQEQAFAAQSAVVEERQRIARELHDVIAHSVSVMTVQAGAVRRLLNPEQEKERQALLSVEETGREALTEMRRFVGLLKQDSVMPEYAPQPSLASLDQLLDTVRDAGLPVELTRRGRAPRGAARRRALGVPGRAGGAHERAQVRGPGTGLGPRALAGRRDRAGGDERREGAGSGKRRRPRARRHARARGARRRHDRERPAPRGRLRGEGAPAAGARAVSVRVLIVDDQSLVRAGFRMILEAEPDLEVVGEAADGAEAVEAAREERPDVILMDVRMPNVDGLEATRRILDGRETGPKILILTTFDLDEYVYEALRAGASGFLLKDTPPEDLVDAIRVVAGGDALLSPSITRRVIEEFVRRPPASVRTPPPELEELTAREREMLGYLARGLSNAEIAREAFVSETTVKTHVARILMKLRLRDRVQAVVFAYEYGIAQPGDPGAR